MRILLLLLLSAANLFAYTVSGNVYTTNGSQSDVQAACSAAPAGAKVVLPSGSFSWTKGITVNTELTITGTGQWSGGSGNPLTGGTQIICNYPCKWSAQ